MCCSDLCCVVLSCIVLSSTYYCKPNTQLNDAYSSFSYVFGVANATPDYEGNHLCI